MGLELDEPKLGAFAGALNALDFPAQLLVRQHAPSLGRLRENLQEAQPESLPPQTKAASESPPTLADRPGKARRHPGPALSTPCASSGGLTSCEGCWRGPGCPSTRSGAASCGCCSWPQPWAAPPAEFDEDAPVEVEINRRDMRIGGTLVRSLHLGKWPRVPRSRLPPGADGRRSADGPVRPRRPDFPPSRRPGRWSGRRCASSRRSPSPSSGAAPCPRRRRSPWRTSPVSGTRCSGAGSGSSTPRSPSPFTRGTRRRSRR